MAIFFMACSSDKNKTTLVTLNVSDSFDQEAEIVILKDFINYEQENIIATPNEDGLFTFELNITHPQMVYLTVGQNRISLFVNQGGDLHIEANAEDFQNSLSFSGEYATENNLLVHSYTPEILENYSQSVTFNKYRTTQAAEFISYADQMLNEAMALLEAKKLSKDFKNYYTTDVNYTYYTMLLNFPDYHEYFNGVRPELPEDYFEFLDEALNHSEKDFYVGSFTGFLDNYTQYYMRNNQEELPADLGYFEQTHWVANQLYSGRAKYFTLANAINSSFSFGDFKRSEQFFNEFKEENPYPEYTALLQQSYDDALRVAPGNAAPSFTLTDIDGNSVSLEDFKGKVVYLDFWASWCGPCMREVPHAKELKERFKGQDDLVFLYISVDEDLEAWKNTVAQHEIKGVHLNIQGMGNETAELYNVKGVPTFYIIDREGVIHDNNPGRPSSGDLIDQQLKDALGV